MSTQICLKYAISSPAFLSTDNRSNSSSNPQRSAGLGNTDRTYLAEEARAQQSKGASGFWTVEYYQSYFDVDTKTVLQRCYTTLNPLAAPAYIPNYLSPADLYGPFWTLTTLIFALFLSSSLAASVSAYLSAEGSEYDYDFKLLSIAVTLVYAYGLAVPVVLWLALRYLGVGEWSVVEAISVWGYGQFVWIPVSVRSLYFRDAPRSSSRHPLGSLRYPSPNRAVGPCRTRIWPLRILPWSKYISHPRFCKHSMHPFALRILPLLLQAEAKATRLLIIVLAALHLGVALSFKVLFFSYYVVEKIGADIPIPGGDLPTGGANSTAAAVRTILS